MIHRMPTAPVAKYFDASPNPAVTTGKVRRNVLLCNQRYPLHGKFTPGKAK